MNRLGWGYSGYNTKIVDDSIETWDTKENDALRGVTLEEYKVSAKAIHYIQVNKIKL